MFLQHLLIARHRGCGRTFLILGTSRELTSFWIAILGIAILGITIFWIANPDIAGLVFFTFCFGFFLSLLFTAAI